MLTRRRLATPDSVVIALRREHPLDGAVRSVGVHVVELDVRGCQQQGQDAMASLEVIG